MRQRKNREKTKRAGHGGAVTWGVGLSEGRVRQGGLSPPRIRYARGSCRPSLRPNVLKRLDEFEEDLWP
jgi:hypothetical protein